MGIFYKIIPFALWMILQPCVTIAQIGFFIHDLSKIDDSYRVMSIDNEEIHRLTVFKRELSFDR